MSKCPMDNSLSPPILPGQLKHFGIKVNKEAAMIERHVALASSDSSDLANRNTTSQQSGYREQNSGRKVSYLFDQHD
jgi:hypothetical protein